MMRAICTLEAAIAGFMEEQKMDLKTIYYVVERIDGDYAYLRQTEEAANDLKLVARALLPQEISEGSRLKYEMFQYEMIG